MTPTEKQMNNKTKELLARAEEVKEQNEILLKSIKNTKQIYQEFAFVYTKNEKIKVCGFAEAKATEKELLADGWVHTSTIDICRFLEYIYNECNAEKALKNIYGLSSYEQWPVVAQNINDITRRKNESSIE